MKITSSTIVAMLTVALPKAVESTSEPLIGITREMCESQGGTVVGDLTGDVYHPSYICESTNERPTDLVGPAEGQPWPEEYEVCCGGTGDGGDLNYSTDNPSHVGSTYSWTLTVDECNEYYGEVVEDSGDGAVFSWEYLCASDNFPPVGNVTNAEGGDPIGVCCHEKLAGFSMTPEECAENKGEVVPDSGDGAVFAWDYNCTGGFPAAGEVSNPGSEDPIGVCCIDYNEVYYTMTEDECGEWYDGMVVQDSGDGAVYEQDYVCASDGFPPVGNVTATDSGERIGVCCLEPWIMTVEECETMVGGEVVVDSGDGAIFQPGYNCTSDGFPPLGLVETEDGASANGVCCLPPLDMTIAPAPAAGMSIGLATPIAKGLKAMSVMKKSNAKAHKAAHFGKH